MRKRAYLEITESELELKKLLSKQKDLRSEKRIKCLMDIKTNKFNTRQELADYLSIHIRTMERWLVNYKLGGVVLMLTDQPRKKGSKIISNEMHKGLEDKVNDPNAPFLGYWDAQQWVKEQYGVEVKYHRIRAYLIQHFKTKLKVPRKSHYKKDNEAKKAFLKTP